MNNLVCKLSENHFLHQTSNEKPTSLSNKTENQQNLTFELQEI